MRKWVAKHMSNILKSPTIGLAAKLRQMKSQGIEIVDFSWGEPDFDTPLHIREAAKKAIDDGYTHYTPSRGLPELLEAIGEKLQLENQLEIEPYQHVIVTPGAKQAILVSLMATLDDEDEVIIFDPCWMSYHDMITMAGGKPIRVPTYETNGFIPTRQSITDKITKQTKIILINNPCNPTAAVWSLEDLRMLGEVAIEYDLLVLSDEVYEKVIFDNHEFVSIASLEGMADRVITVNGFSKAFAMTGWRIGYVVAPEEVTDSILKIQEHSATCACAFAQKGAVAALSGPKEPVGRMIKEYQRRRDFLLGGLSEIDRVSSCSIQGTFYLFLNIKALNMSSAAAADFFLRQARVAMIPGSAFGPSGEGYLRISFSTSQSNIDEGLSRISKAVDGI